MTGYTIYYERIPEHVVPGKRLGRHVRHDSRSRNFAHLNSGQPLKSNVVVRHIPILNQGQAGSCTGNAEVGAIGSGKLFPALMGSPAFSHLVLDEALAVSLYSAAETLDGDGPYPPNDNGSNGVSVCTAAKNMGFISGFTHTFSLSDVLDALSTGSAVICGTNWYDSFDSPDSNGEVFVSPSAQVRGGHEWLVRGINVTDKTILCDNSWGEEWGISGSFMMSWDTLERLLAENGDGTISAPIAVAS